jgi:hypothetical protein
MKLNIRLPDDEGPNPYDSKTMPKDLPRNQWLVSWQWWVGALVAGAFIAGSAWWRGRGG